MCNVNVGVEADENSRVGGNREDAGSKSGTKLGVGESLSTSGPEINRSEITVWGLCGPFPVSFSFFQWFYFLAVSVFCLCHLKNMRTWDPANQKIGSQLLQGGSVGKRGQCS